MQLISDAEKAAYSQALQDIHDTFKRPLVMYKTQQVTVISEDPKFNFVFPNSTDKVVQTTQIQSGVFSGRILHPRIDSNSDHVPVDDARFRNALQFLRLKLDASGYNFFQGTERVIVDGFNYEPIKAVQPHGLFNVDFYTVYCKRVD